MWSFLPRDAAITSIRRSTATVYVVGVARSERASSDVGLLQEVADSSGGNLVWAEDDSRLLTVFTRVFDEYRTRYLLTYSPSGVRRDDGWHKIDVTLKAKRGKIKVRPGYFASSR